MANALPINRSIIALGLALTASPAHWQTMTFVAALRHDRIEAPWLIDGPIDDEGFQTYVEKALTPMLKPVDVVIMDNLGSHKGEAVRQAIRSAGAKLFFLPDTRPI
jgi:transposase